MDTVNRTRRNEPADLLEYRLTGEALVGDCEERRMRALWSRKIDENAERYRARTSDRLRGLASTEIVGRPAEPSGVRARVERLKAETEPDREQQREMA